MEQNRNDVKSCNVIDKVLPILICKPIKDTTTTKPGRDGEKYLATNEMHPHLKEKLNGAKFKVTLKVDGTNCFISEGIIWKRRDLKSDRNVPLTWVRTGNDKDGHLIGIMPLEKGDTWHHDCYVKDSNMNKIMILDLNETHTGLEYKEVDTASLNGQSIEIMGPKFQKNLHGLKMHCAMRHGLISISDFPDLNEVNILQSMKDWFSNSPLGAYSEGVVLHLDDGTLFKLHRHHLDMVWDASKVPPLDQIKL